MHTGSTKKEEEGNHHRKEAERGAGTQVKGGESFGGFGVGVEVVGLDELPHQLETIAGDSNVQQLNPSQLRHGRVRGHL